MVSLLKGYKEMNSREEETQNSIFLQAYCFPLEWSSVFYYVFYRLLNLTYSRTTCLGFTLILTSTVCDLERHFVLNAARIR